MASKVECHECTRFNASFETLVKKGAWFRLMKYKPLFNENRFLKDSIFEGIDV